MCAFCSDSSSEIRVLIAESNCVYASLKRRLCSLFPICCHSCEWLLLSSSAENGEIRALTSNLSSNSIAPTTARNIRHRQLFNPAAGFFLLKTNKEIGLHATFTLYVSRECRNPDTDVTLCFFQQIIELTNCKNEFSVIKTDYCLNLSRLKRKN